MVAILLTGDDPTLIAEALRARIDELVGDGDRGLMLEELTEDSYRTDSGFDAARLIDAAQTPPFLTERRVVVGRHLGRFSKKDDVAALVAYLAEPLGSTDLVLVWERGEQPQQDRLPAVPKSLKDALERAGATMVATALPKGKGAAAWLDARLADSALRFDRRAAKSIADALGEDRSRVLGLVSTLETAFPAGHAISDDEVRPYLGERGTVPPWELTDAIDTGDVAVALDKLERLLGAGDRHPLAVLASLHAHFGRLLALDGADVRDEKAAAALLGMKGSTFPAKKALTASRRLGSAKTKRAIRLLADADLQLRGAVAWPPELVIEVTVARLASLSSRR